MHIIVYMWYFFIFLPGLSRVAPLEFRSPSVVSPYPLRLFYGCLTVLCRRGVGPASERNRSYRKSLAVTISERFLFTALWW